MPDYSQRVSDSFNERMRLIRLRRKKENLRFWEEFRIIPRWLIVLVIVLFLAAQATALFVNLNAARFGGEIFPPDLKNHPATASVALAGIVTAVSLVMASLIFMVAYVNRDAKRRGMNSTLWTLLVLILSPGWLIIGFVIYFLMRAPEAPMGWPSATAPPLTFTFSGLSLSWRVTAIAATEKASLSSTKSTSLSRFQPVFVSSFSTASTGAIMTHFGSTPLTACATMRAIGCFPRRAALRSLVTIKAAAPSLVPGALPAVTVPSLLNAGFSFASTSNDVSSRGDSSYLMTMGS